MPNEQMPGEQPAGIDFDAIVNEIKVPPNLKPVYDKAVLSGLRLMFDKQSHKMMLDQLAKNGDLAKNISDGAISLVYMLYQKSNKTLPPQLGIPVGFNLVVRAVEFLQKSGDQRATPELLGQAIELFLTGMGLDDAAIEKMTAGVPQ